MEIRLAQPRDTRDVAELWCDAFPGKRTVADRIRMLESGGRYGGLETVLVTHDGQQRLAGACKIYRMRQVVAGAIMPMMGLAAVAIAPFARRRGLGRELCGAALRAARERGDLISSLYPFRPEYYRRLGWGLAGELHEYRIHTHALPASEEARSVRRARPEEDMGEIAACYDRATRNANGPIERDARIWAYRMTGEDLGVRPVEEDAPLSLRGDPTLRAVVYGETRVTGYALLRHRPARSPAEHTLELRELVAETEAAYRGLLGHVANQADQWPWMIHRARPDERFADRISDPRPPRYRSGASLYFPTARVVRGPMLRVLDVPAALAARPWFRTAANAEGPGSGAGAPVILRIEVTDDQLTENAGAWTLRIEEGRGTVERAAAATAGDAGAPYTARLSTDASGLARMFAGEVAPTAAARIGRAEVTGDAALLDRAFATRHRFWLPDEF